LYPTLEAFITDSPNARKDAVRQFFKGEPVDAKKFLAICEKLGITDWESIVDWGDEQEVEPEHSFSEPPHNVLESGVRDGGFFGRDDRLKKLHAELQKPGRMRVAVSGMGGVGKTEFSIQYAKKYFQHYPGGICWISVRTDDSNQLSIASQIISFSKNKLKLNIPLSTSDQVQFCIDNWTKGNVLIIFDDIEKYEEIKSFLELFSDNRFKVVVTTRLKLRDPFIFFDLDVLDRIDSIELLKWLSENETIFYDDPLSQELCEFLGDLPLGIELAGRYLAIESGIPTSLLLSQLKEFASRKEALHHEAFQGDFQQNPNWSLTARRGLDAAFELTWKILDSETQEIAIFIGHLPPRTDIAWTVVELMKQIELEENSAINTDELVNLDKSRSKFISLNLLKPVKDLTYRLHPLLREFFRNKVSNQDYE
jgi:nucleoside-triphosphatase THEP1